MKKTISAALALSILLLLGSAIAWGQATPSNYVQWTFEANLPAIWSGTVGTTGTTPFVGTNPASNPIQPEFLAGGAMGTFGASGSHTSGSTLWTAPVGNGTAHSLNSNNWSQNTDYYQFQVSTTNVADLYVSYDQISSSTGPNHWQFAYSTDGTNFTSLGSSYTTFPTSGATTWSGGTAITTTSHVIDLTTIPSL